MTSIVVIPLATPRKLINCAGLRSASRSRSACGRDELASALANSCAVHDLAATFFVSAPLCTAIIANANAHALTTNCFERLKILLLLTTTPHVNGTHSPARLDPVSHLSIQIPKNANTTVGVGKPTRRTISPKKSRFTTVGVGKPTRRTISPKKSRFTTVGVGKPNLTFGHSRIQT